MTNNREDQINIGNMIFISGMILLCIFGIISGIGIVMLLSDEEGGTLFITGTIGIFLCAIPVLGFGQLVDDIHILREEFINNNNYYTNRNMNNNKVSREQARQYFKQ